MGISYPITLPFIFGFAPLIGYVFDQAGGYRLPFLVTASMLVTAGLFSVLMIFVVCTQQRLERTV